MTEKDIFENLAVLIKKFDNGNFVYIGNDSKMYLANFKTREILCSGTVVFQFKDNNYIYKDDSGEHLINHKTKKEVLNAYHIWYNKNDECYNYITEEDGETKRFSFDQEEQEKDSTKNNYDLIKKLFSDLNINKKEYVKWLRGLCDELEKEE